MRAHWAEEITGTATPFTAGKPFAGMGFSRHPTLRIIEQEQEQDCDLIVMGKHGEGS